MPTNNPQETEVTVTVATNGSGPATATVATNGSSPATATQTAAAPRMAPTLQPTVFEREHHLRHYKSLNKIDLLLGKYADQWFSIAGRIALFVIYFWFGILKLLGMSPAFSLANELVNHTIGPAYFSLSYNSLAVFECVIGIMWLVPRLTNLVFILMMIHMGIVWSPLFLLGGAAWMHVGVPTFEGQYIIKNLALMALAIGIVAYRKFGRSRREYSF